MSVRTFTSLVLVFDRLSFYSRALTLVEIDKKVTYTMKDFVSLQVRCMSRAVEGLGRLREEIAAVVLSTCKVSISRGAN